MLNFLQPIADKLHDLLTFLYVFTHDYTLAIVLLTIIIKVILHPLTRVQLRSMKAMQVLAPHVEALKRKHKDDPQTLNREMMALYRTYGVNPMMGCLPMIVQMPVLWALFRLLYTKNLFGNATVFGISWMRLDARPQDMVARIPSHPVIVLVLIIPLLVAATTWWQSRMSTTDPQQARMFMFMPFMIGYFALLYPIGLSIYWIVSTVAYIGEFFLVVGRPHPMASAPPRSQAQVSGGGGGHRPPGAPGSGAKPLPAPGVRPQPGPGGRPASLPRGKRGAKRA